jgi:alkylation response protein AidB-like acyl-CoA dehydrogenase
MSLHLSDAPHLPVKRRFGVGKSGSSMTQAHTPQNNGAEISDLLREARSLSLWLQGQAARIESEKRIPEDVVERLAGAGLFRLTQPPLFGGLGLTPREAWEAVFEVGRGCGSSAWIVGLNVANVLMLGKFSEQAQRDVFLCGKPAMVSMLTGGVGSGIQVDHAPGGVLLSGRWRYASGIDVASWVGILVSIPDGAAAAPEPHVVLVPQHAFSIDHSSWNVLGMRGTGSKDISLPPTFVPEHRFLSWNLLQAGGKHPSCPNDEAIYEYPLNSIFAMSVLAPLVGVASAVAEEFCELVKIRVNAGTQQKQRDDKVAQIDCACGEATMSIVRQALLDDADFVLDIIRSGRSLTPLERGAVRMRLAVISRLALSAAQKMFSALGGSLLPSGSRAERLFRDLHAMSSHFLLQPDAIGEAYGRLLLGLELPPGARL